MCVEIINDDLELSHVHFREELTTHSSSFRRKCHADFEK
jgi:hypothetical protein